MLLRQIFDPYLAQYAYLVGCPRSGEALVIDPERDIHRYRELAKENDLRITAVAETHIHADFVSGARELAVDPDVHLYLSAEGGKDWTYQWPGDRSNTHYLRHGDSFDIGNIRVEAVHSPGHTPEHLSYLITDLGGGADAPIALATGDFLFVGDAGRPDLLESAAGMAGLMEPSARTLRASLAERLTGMEDFVQVLPGHGAGSACGKSLGAVPTSTIGYERRFNGALRLAARDAEGFVSEILRGQPDPPVYFATMKRVNRDGIAVLGGCPDSPRIEPAAAKAMLDAGEVVVLDGRDGRDVFAAGSLPGAIHAPLHGPYFSAGGGSYLKEEDRVLVVAESQADGELAATQLFRIGFDHFVGWIHPDDWKNAGLPWVEGERIEFEDFDAEAAAAEGVILDVRTTSEFAAGHLDGAISIPYTRLRDRLDEVPKGKRVFVHCGSGRRASPAASFLRSRGYDAVHIDGICAECDRIAEEQGVTH